MHFQHSCIVFGGLGADHHDEIDILSTILVLVQNHSKSCPEMMKIIVYKGVPSRNQSRSLRESLRKMLNLCELI